MSYVRHAFRLKVGREWERESTGIGTFITIRCFRRSLYIVAEDFGECAAAQLQSRTVFSLRELPPFRRTRPVDAASGRGAFFKYSTVPL